MKMKKIAAASLAVCVCALSGMSALADVTVATTTTYDWNNKGNGNATVDVTSVVSGVVANTQVTYLVWGGNENTIRYIDQKAANSEGKAEFGFTGKQSEIYDGTIVAKFGSNGSETVPTNFKFVEGVNRMENGTATVSTVDGYTDGTVIDVDGVSGKAYYGRVSGKVAEYGIKVTVGGDVKYFPAAGSTADGLFCVVISDLPENATVETYWDAQ